MVKGIDCIGTDEGQSPAETGTALAAPMKAAARYLLNYDANNLTGLPARSDPVTKVVIYETDGQPNERITYTAANQFNRFTGSTSLTASAEPFASQMSLNPSGVTKTQGDSSSSNTSGSTTTKTITHNKTLEYTYNGGANACQNLINVAAEAKAQGLLVIMIAYNLTGKKCFDWDGFAPGYEDRTNYTASTGTVSGPESQTSVTKSGKTTITKYQTTTVTKHVKAADAALVLNVMAQAASPNNGVAASANNSCLNPPQRATENADGDYFFCAASGTDMAPIFKTALSQVSKGIKLIKMP